MTSGAEVVWQHAETLAVIESDDRVALLDLKRPSDPPRVLEGSAAAIWKAVDGERPVSDVVDAVAEAFEVEASDVRGDVQDFLGSLASAGLLEAS